MDCEHQFEKFVIGKPKSTGLDRAAYRQICWICGRTETEVHLITQLLEAQAEIERLKPALEQIARTTMQADTKSIARKALYPDEFESKSVARRIALQKETKEETE
jgi:hypothetical protein